MAIGASRANVLRVVLGRIALLLGIGAAAGLAARRSPRASCCRRSCTKSSPHDPVVLAGVAAVIVVVGAIASWAPARRSLRTQPMEALRPE